MPSSHHLCPVSLFLPLDYFYRDNVSRCLVFTFFTLPRLQEWYLVVPTTSLCQLCITVLLIYSFLPPSTCFPPPPPNRKLLDETFFFLIYPCFPLPKTKVTGYGLPISFSFGEILFPSVNFYACLFDKMANWRARKTKRWWVGELVFSTMSSYNTKFPFLQVHFTGMGVILNFIIRNDKIFRVLSFIFHRILSTCKLLSSCFSIFPLIFWNPVQWRHKGLRYLLS